MINFKNKTNFTNYKSKNNVKCIENVFRVLENPCQPFKRQYFKVALIIIIHAQKIPSTRISWIQNRETIYTSANTYVYTLLIMNWWKCDLLLKLVKTAFICIKCNNLRVTLGNSVDMKGLLCQTLFYSFSLWEKWTGSLQTIKGKSSFSARKKSVLMCPNIVLWTAICSHGGLTM